MDDDFAQQDKSLQFREASHEGFLSAKYATHLEDLLLNYLDNYNLITTNVTTAVSFSTASALSKLDTNAIHKVLLIIIGIIGTLTQLHGTCHWLTCNLGLLLSGCSLTLVITTHVVAV